MSLWNQLAPDRKAEAEGIPVDIVGGDDVWRFYVAAASDGNKRYLATMERVRRKHKRSLSLDTLSIPQQKAIIQEAYSEAIVLKWCRVENHGEDNEKEIDFVDEKGSKMPCTPPNVMKVFKALPKIWEAVSEAASNSSNFLLSSVEEDEGN